MGAQYGQGNNGSYPNGRVPGASRQGNSAYPYQGSNPQQQNPYAPGASRGAGQYGAGSVRQASAPQQTYGQAQYQGRGYSAPANVPSHSAGRSSASPYAVGTGQAGRSSIPYGRDVAGPVQRGTLYDSGAIEPVSTTAPANISKVGAHDGMVRTADTIKAKRGHGALLCLLGVVVGLLVGLAICYFFFGLGGSSLKSVSGTLGSSQLDAVVGSYRYAGETYDITAREAIMGSQSLDSSKNADGTYDTPSADMILSFARNKILAKMVDEAGIAVSEQEVLDYALGLFGTNDMATIAGMLGMTSDQALRTLNEAAAVGKLRAQVCSSATAEPQAPALPYDGNTEVANADYFYYIVGLLGPYWNGNNNTWASTDNPFYQALQGKPFAEGSASYESAQAAYSVAYQLYTQSSTNAEALWEDFVNERLDDGAISIATLRA